jgi:nucleoside-diphosphate-sugar epimerase
MNVLFIGGTGNISGAVSRLAVARGIDLALLTRGQRPVAITGARSLAADIRDPRAFAAALGESQWDAVVNWIAFTPADIERDLALFAGRTRQYVFISSASVYQKPLRHPVVTESTPLANPFWEYARNKIACEDRLNRACRESGFPGVVVRPSLTYDTVIPLAIGSWADWTMIERMRSGRPVVVHGDGSSLWTITHADDFAKGFVPLLGNPATIGHAFHITSDELLTWDQIWQQTAAAAGCEARIVHIPSDFIVHAETALTGSLLGDKSVSVIFDNTKIKRFVPGFTATVPYSEGIRRTLAWFQADPARMRIVEANNAIHDRLLAAYGRAPVG